MRKIYHYKKFDYDPSIDFEEQINYICEKNINYRYHSMGQEVKKNTLHLSSNPSNTTTKLVLFFETYDLYIDAQA